MADGRPPPPGSPLQGPIHQSPQSNSKPSFVNLLKSNHISSNSHHSIAGDSADLRPFAKLQDGATSLNKTGSSTFIGALKIDLLPKNSSNYLINGITSPASQGQIRFAGIMNGQSSRNDSDSTPSIEDSMGLNPISIFEGKPSVLFSSSTKSLLVDKLKFVLVGKFSHGRPSLQSIKVFFMKLKLKGDCNVSSFDKKHIFIECLCKEDYYRIWLHLNWIIDGFDMRVFKWSPDFSPLRECSIVPVWIRLQGLPLYLFDTHSLLSIANSIGHLIKVDDRNVNRSMLNSARICVELDINKPFVEDVRISFLDESTKAIVNGFWVKVFYDVVPSFCSFCLHIGHDSQICKRKDSELEFQLKRNMGKIITEDDGKTDQNAQLKVQGTCLKDQLAAHVLQLNVAVECPQLDDSPTSAAAHGDKLPAGDSAEGECAVGELPTGKLTGTAGDTRGLTLVSSVHSKVDTLQGANHNKGDSQQAVAVLEEQNMQQQVISSSLGGAEHADLLHNTCEHHVLRDDSNMDGSGKFTAESDVYGNSLGQTGADPGLIISIHNTTDQGKKKLASPRENGMVLTVPKDDSKQKLEVECTAVQSVLEEHHVNMLQDGEQNTEQSNCEQTAQIRLNSEQKKTSIASPSWADLVETEAGELEVIRQLDFTQVEDYRRHQIRTTGEEIDCSDVTCPLDISESYMGQIAPGFEVNQITEPLPTRNSFAALNEEVSIEKLALEEGEIVVSVEEVSAAPIKPVVSTTVFLSSESAVSAKQKVVQEALEDGSVVSKTKSIKQVDGMLASKYTAPRLPPKLLSAAAEFTPKWAVLVEELVEGMVEKEGEEQKETEGTNYAMEQLKERMHRLRGDSLPAAPILTASTWVPPSMTKHLARELKKIRKQHRSNQNWQDFQDVSDEESEEGELDEKAESQMLNGEAFLSDGMGDIPRPFKIKSAPNSPKGRNRSYDSSTYLLSRRFF